MKVSLNVVPMIMKRTIMPILVALLLSGCATDRFMLVNSKAQEEFGPFLFRTGSQIRINDQTYRMKRVLGRNEYLIDRMKGQIIPVVEFRDANIQDIIGFCRESFMVRNDNDAIVNPLIDILLIVPDDAKEKIPTVTISARFISVYKLMEIISEMTGLDFIIEDGRAWLKSKK